VDWSPDGHHLAAASFDGKAYVWALEDAAAATAGAPTTTWT
jgi:hypothetical protein